MPSANKLPHSKFCTRPPGRSWRLATDHSGMSPHTHFQPGTTIVEVHGAVDTCNAEPLSNYVDHLASPGRSLILDLRRVDFFGRDGLRALGGIAEKSQRTGLRCALVTIQAVDNRAWSRPHHVTPPKDTRC